MFKSPRSDPWAYAYAGLVVAFVLGLGWLRLSPPAEAQFVIRSTVQQILDADCKTEACTEEWQFCVDTAGGDIGLVHECDIVTGFYVLIDIGGGGGGLTHTVNASPLASSTAIDFDDALPAAPAGSVNVLWFKDALSPTNVAATPDPTGAYIWTGLHTMQGGLTVATGPFIRSDPEVFEVCPVGCEYSTIQSAVTDAMAAATAAIGTVVSVLPGTYSETVTIGTITQTTPGNVVLRGHSRESVEIVASHASLATLTIHGFTTVIRDLTVTSNGDRPAIQWLSTQENRAQIINAHLKCPNHTGTLGCLRWETANVGGGAPRLSLIDSWVEYVVFGVRWLSHSDIYTRGNLIESIATAAPASMIGILNDVNPGAPSMTWISINDTVTTISPNVAGSTGRLSGIEIFSSEATTSHIYNATIIAQNLHSNTNAEVVGLRQFTGGTAAVMRCYDCDVTASRPASTGDTYGMFVPGTAADMAAYGGRYRASNSDASAFDLGQTTSGILKVSHVDYTNSTGTITTIDTRRGLFGESLVVGDNTDVTRSIVFDRLAGDGIIAYDGTEFLFNDNINVGTFSILSTGAAISLQPDTGFGVNLLGDGIHLISRSGLTGAATVLRIDGDFGTGAANDEVRIEMRLTDAAGGQYIGGRIHATTDVATAGSEDARMSFNVATGGVSTRVLILGAPSNPASMTLGRNVDENIAFVFDALVGNASLTYQTVGPAFSLSHKLDVPEIERTGSFTIDVNGSGNDMFIDLFSQDGTESFVVRDSAGGFLMNIPSNGLNVMTAANAAAGTVVPLKLQVTRSGVGADNDTTRMEFTTEDDLGAAQIFGTINVRATDVTSTTKDSDFRVTLLTDNASSEQLRLTGATGGNLSFGRPTDESRTLTFNQSGTDGIISHTVGGGFVFSGGTITTGSLAVAVVLDTESPAAGDVTGSFSGGLQVTADSHTHDVDNLTGITSWDNGFTKTTNPLTISGVNVDFEGGASEGFPKLAQSITAPAAECNEASETGRLYNDTDAAVNEKLVICTGAGGWERVGGSGGGFTQFFIDGDNTAPQTITDGNTALFVGGVGIDTVAGVTDQITFNFDATEILGTTTWGAGAAQTFVWNVGATAPTFAFTNNSVVITNAATFNHPDGSVPVADLNSTVTQAELDALAGTNTGDEVTATESTQGIMEIATQVEADAGTGTNLAVTADKLEAWNGGSNVAEVGTITAGVWTGTDILDADIADLLTVDMTDTSRFPRTNTATSLRGEMRVPTATDGFFWFTASEHQAADLDSVQSFVTGAKTFAAGILTVAAGSWANAAHDHSTNDGGTILAASVGNGLTDAQVVDTLTVDLNAASLFPRTDAATNARGEMRVTTAGEGLFFFTSAEHEVLTLDLAQTVTGGKTMNSDSLIVTAGNWTNAAHDHTANNGGTLAGGVFTAQSIDGDDIATTLAGLHLTMDTGASPDEIDLDIEIRTRVKSFNIFDPATGDSDKIQWAPATAITIVKVWCSTDVATSTVTLMPDERAEATPNTQGTDVLSAGLVCDDLSQSSCASGCDVNTITNASIDAFDPVSWDIDATANSPTVVRVHVEFTMDDI